MAEEQTSSMSTIKPKEHCEDELFVCRVLIQDEENHNFFVRTQDRDKKLPHTQTRMLESVKDLPL